MLASFVSLVIVLQGSQAGQSLVDASYQKLLKATSVTIELKILDIQTPVDIMTYMAMKGGYTRLKGGDEMEVYATPEGSYILQPKDKSYMKSGAAGPNEFPIPGFEAFRKDAKPLKAIGEPKRQTVEGMDVYAVPVDTGGNAGFKDVTLYLDAKTSLPAGAKITAGGQTGRLIVTSIQLDTLNADTFKWTPPADWKDMMASIGTTAGMKAGEDPYEAKLLKVGAVAPDFAAKTPDGSVVKLSTLRKGHRATLVNFWFYG